jgi:hypothetical protein
MTVVHVSDFSYFVGHYAYVIVGLTLMQPTLFQNPIARGLVVLVALLNASHLDNMYW